MRSALKFLAAPLVVLAASLLFDRGAEVARALPPAEEHGPPLSARPADGPDGDAVAAATDAVRAAAPAMPAPSPEDLRREQVRLLLASLESWASANAPVFPSLEIEEARGLLDRRPELAGLFLAALGGADGKLREYLAHVFYGLSDEILRERLVAEFRATSTTSDRLKEILGDPALLLAALREPGDVQITANLLSRIGDSALDDPQVVDSLRSLADDDEEPGVRKRAIRRLGRLDRPWVRSWLLEILEDPARPLTDRQAAIGKLRVRPSPDAVKVFTDILRRPDAEASLVRLAALGLKNAAGDSDARDALFDLLRRETGDSHARQNALTALASCLRSLDGPARARFRVRLRGALGQLSSQAGSRTLVRFSVDVLSRVPGGGFDADSMQQYIDDAGDVPGYR